MNLWYINTNGNFVQLEHKQEAAGSVTWGGGYSSERAKFSVQVPAAWTVCTFCIQGHQVKCLWSNDIRDFHFPDECYKNVSFCHFLLLPLYFLCKVLCPKRSTLVDLMQIEALIFKSQSVLTTASKLQVAAAVVERSRIGDTYL